MVSAILALLHAGGGAKPWMLGPFVRESAANPVLQASRRPSFFDPMGSRAVAWQAGDAFNPAAITRRGVLILLFRAEDAHGSGIGGHTSRIGYAASADGVHFRVRPTPILYPALDSARPFDWPGGCEDPRVVRGPNFYVMTYTSWNKTTARLSVATSPDLIHWRKRGPAFGRASGGKWLGLWSKSGAIVTKKAGDQVVAAKVAGRYWMYFGDLDVSIATSRNLVDWTPVTNSQGHIRPVLSPRRNHFDSDLCESGPPALLTSRGIVLLYNGKNSARIGDANLPPNIYAAGQALFDPDNPARLVDRADSPFFKPEQPYEVTGQYASGTVFIEGLAWFHRHWVLAYGAADSRVALAVSR